MRTDVDTLRSRSEDDRKSLPQMIETIVERKLAGSRQEVAPSREVQGRRPRLGNAPPVSSNHDSKYWEARKTLRLWAVPDVSVEAVKDFFVDKLLMDVSFAENYEFKCRGIPSVPGADAQHQAVVTLTSVGQREEVRAMAKNLNGRDKKVGLQLEPPDHL